MPSIPAARLLRPVAAGFLIAACHCAAKADAITVSGYTVTDLGAGSPTFIPANGNSMILAPDGRTAYAFPEMLNAGVNGGTGQGALANIPLVAPAPTYSPDTYGNPANAFAYVQSAVVNANGIAAVVEVTGVNGHWYAGDAYYVPEKSNGSWGVPVPMFSGPTDLDGSAYPHQASAQQLGISIAGINNLNQVLGYQQYGPNSWQSGPIVYNINTQTSVQLGNLDGNYLNVQPIAIADNGQLLLEGQPVATGGPDHTLLLTPGGVSPDPLTVAPEPASWVVMALTATSFALGQFRERRRTRRRPESNLAS